ncbi:Fasciclin domain-containing protein [Stachybotrys elegans]|uniref:Fasciclin domain-containing protein n=1 Tax=Stachybotrys elegans TaxID=80388 RepID=A0A8K0SWV0_9HYPO|nr:Fasciclin domain-containing protein [Stachybotrys elegans]
MGTAADGVADGQGDSHHHSNATLYQVIHGIKDASKFAKLIDEYPSIVKLLNSTSGPNHTVFVPLDVAFEHIPKHHKPSKEFVEEVLLYHIGVGSYPARRILGTHTIPTALNASRLGGDAQRLRTRVGLGGARVNFYSKIVAIDKPASNGIVHGVSSIIVPPPAVGPELSLFPDKFSTLLLAYGKTHFVEYIHAVKMVGSTVFAPTNNAFSRLGPKVNAFLFNTRTGLKYLDAILKYHIVANATLYSDAFYDHSSSSSNGASSGGDVEAERSQHFDLTTLLHDVHVGVDIGRVLGFVTMRVNGFTHVAVQDGIAANGVIQVLDKVLIPPHKNHGGLSVSDDMTVEELRERLDAYLD